MDGGRKDEGRKVGRDEVRGVGDRGRRVVEGWKDMDT